MPFNKFNQWEALPAEKWLPDDAAKTCQFMDRITLKRCTSFLSLNNREHCKECGILICNKHFQCNYRGHRVCDTCHYELTATKSLSNSFSDTEVDFSSGGRFELFTQSNYHQNLDQFIKELNYLATNGDQTMVEIAQYNNYSEALGFGNLKLTHSFMTYQVISEPAFEFANEYQTTFLSEFATQGILYSQWRDIDFHRRMNKFPKAQLERKNTMRLFDLKIIMLKNKNKTYHILLNNCQHYCNDFFK